MTTQMTFLKPSDEIKAVPDKALVVRPNLLNKAMYRFTIAEQRIVALCYSKMKVREKVERRYRIYQTEYRHFFGISKSTACKQMQDGLARLYERSIGWPTMIDGQLSYREVRLITGKSEPYNKKGFIELDFHEEVLPLLSYVKSEFNWYNLYEFGKLTKADSWRLAELCAQHRNFSDFEFEVQELRDFWGLGDKYPQFKDFHKEVIVPSVEEVNEKTNFSLRFDKIKTGRSVTSIKFYLEVKFGTPQGSNFELDLEDDKDSGKELIEDWETWGYASKANFISAMVAVQAQRAAWPMMLADYNELVELGKVPELT